MLKNAIGFVKANKKAIIEQTIIGAGVIIAAVLATGLRDDQADDELVEFDEEIKDEDVIDTVIEDE